MPNLVRHDLILRLLQDKADALRLLPGVTVGKLPAPEQDLPRSCAVGGERRLQLAQQRGLAAAGHAAQQQKFPFFHRKRYIPQRGSGCHGVGKGHMLDRDRRHAIASFRFSSRGRLHKTKNALRDTAPHPPTGENTGAG